MTQLSDPILRRRAVKDLWASIREHDKEVNGAARESLLELIAHLKQRMNFQ